MWITFCALYEADKTRDVAKIAKSVDNSVDNLWRKVPLIHRQKETH